MKKKQGGLMAMLAAMSQDPSNSIVAHIMPSEAKALERRNGGGSINPVTGLPEFWSDGGGKEDGDSIGGGRRGGDAGFSDTERGSSWGGGDSGGWGGFGDSFGGDSMGSAMDGISNVDASRAREARADMMGDPDSLRGVVDRAARGEIFSDDQERQERVKEMWDKATEFQEYPGMSRLERGWNKLTRADNVMAGAFGLLGSLTGIPGAGFAASKLGGWLGQALTPASTVANLGRTKGTVGAGYAGFGGVPTDAGKSYGLGRTAGADPGRMAGMGGFVHGNTMAGGYGGDSPTYEPPAEPKETEEEKKKREEEEKKKQQEERKFWAKLFGVEWDEDTDNTKIEAEAVKVPGWPYA